MGSPVGPIYEPSSGETLTIGIHTELEFNSSAVLAVAILGSIRTIRDFVEGPSLLRDDIQSAPITTKLTMVLKSVDSGLIKITTTTMTFTSINHLATQQSSLKRDLILSTHYSPNPTFLHSFAEMSRVEGYNHPAEFCVPSANREIDIEGLPQKSAAQLAITSIPSLQSIKHTPQSLKYSCSMRNVLPRASSNKILSEKASNGTRRIEL